jgi:hypothetical protein
MDLLHSSYSVAEVVRILADHEVYFCAVRGDESTATPQALCDACTMLECAEGVLFIAPKQDRATQRRIIDPDGCVTPQNEGPVIIVKLTVDDTGDRCQYFEPEAHVAPPVAEFLWQDGVPGVRARVARWVAARGAAGRARVREEMVADVAFGRRKAVLQAAKCKG